MNELEEDDFRLKELDSQVKEEGSKKTVNFKFCPSCGSTNLKPVIYGFGKDSAALSPQMKCVDCGFYGFPVEGTPESIQEYREELKEKRRETEK